MIGEERARPAPVPNHVEQRRKCGEKPNQYDGTDNAVGSVQDREHDHAHREQQRRPAKGGSRDRGLDFRARRNTPDLSTERHRPISSRPGVRAKPEAATRDATAILTKSAEERARLRDPIGEPPHHLVARQRYLSANRGDAHPPNYTNGERRAKHRCACPAWLQRLHSSTMSGPSRVRTPAVSMAGHGVWSPRHVGSVPAYDGRLSMQTHDYRTRDRSVDKRRERSVGAAAQSSGTETRITHAPGAG